MTDATLKPRTWAAGVLTAGMTEAGLEAVCRHATALTSLDLSGLAAAPAPAPAGGTCSQLARTLTLQGVWEPGYRIAWEHF